MCARQQAVEKHGGGYESAEPLEGNSEHPREGLLRCSGYVKRIALPGNPSKGIYIYPLSRLLDQSGPQYELHCLAKGIILLHGTQNLG